MEHDVEPELPRGIALAWGVAANPQRGPKREMSVERIVEAAVEIADAEGLGAVSMAAVASRLGFTPMSLYRYVTAKDDLILLMQEEATALPPEQSTEPGDWRARLEELYRGQMIVYLRHPWILDIPITGSPITPNSASWMDAGLGALDGTALSHEERLSVMTTMTGQSRWAGSVIAGYTRAQREAGIGGEDQTRQEDALFRSLITADAYPSLRAAVDAGVFLDDNDPFAFGMARFLDGVEHYIAAIATRGHDAPRAWVELDDAEIAGDKKYREARKAVREAEKALRDARKIERQAARDAAERLKRASGGA
ncbi:TetR/AcrR family transcriptional regulator [Microbacterium aoyamense]|uniref:TetR/AcrR family transcriptional regulator n=1 Tax=Microbacterium aoyamense TaxID=344166 RepID=A0ABP5AM16_9MICO|nr:TetR/AcrR family transcriptional regulator [Microbacterium aoyamense]